MEFYPIPFEDGYILYRPLRRLAFAANQATVRLLEKCGGRRFEPASPGEERLLSFLDGIGFFEEDYLPPPEPSWDGSYQPTVAVLCLTTDCNLRCVYCYARGGETERKRLPVELGRRAIDTVCRNAMERGEGRFTLAFHGGGEPTLARREMRELVAYARARELPCRVSLTTNGCWGGGAAWLLDNVDEVSLSLDGLEEVQNRQRPGADGGASFDRALATADELERRGIPYGIRLTVTDESIDCLAAGMAMLCARTNCQVFQVEPAFSHGRASANGTALSRVRRFGEAFLAAWETGAASGRHVYYSGARPWVSTRRFCLAMDKALVVTPEGYLTSCYEVCAPEHPLAGRFLFGTASGDGGWSVDLAARQWMAGRMEERRRGCEGCFCYWSCAGDCPSKAAGNGQTSERCELNRFITQGLLVRYMAAGGGLWIGDEGQAQGVEPCA